MPLQLVVETLDAIPEALRSNYKEADGKFRLDLEGYEDPAGLKSALQKEREAAKNATKQANAWAALGKTPDEIQALVEAQAKAEADKLTKAGEWDKLNAQVQEKHRAELEKKDAAISAKDKALTKHLVILCYLLFLPSFGACAEDRLTGFERARRRCTSAGSGSSQGHGAAVELAPRGR